ncbi:hypothetical protein BAU15_00440 [Enterococcus sp. JM4C]|nr:hypothetical protein BAU15_00440 [Enterococcus sp. JM4C]
MIPFLSISETLPFFLSVFIGTLADRTRRKSKYLFVSSAMRMGIYMGILFVYWQSNQFIFVVVACVLNVVSDSFGKYGGSLLLPVIKLLIPDQEKMERVQGLNSAVGQICSIAGTLIGGFLFTRITLTGLLIINIGLFSLVLFMTLGIVYRCQKIVETIEVATVGEFNFLGELKSTIRLVFKNKKLGRELFLIAITNLLLSLTLPIVSLLSSGETVSGQLSLIQTIQIIFMILGSILTGTLKRVSLTSLFLAFFGTYFMFLLSLMFDRLTISLAFVALFSLSLGLLTPKFMASIISTVAVKNIGGFMGIMNTLIMFAPFVNSLLLQLLIPIVTVKTLIIIYLLLTIMAVGLALITGATATKKNLN